MRQLFAILIMICFFDSIVYHSAQAASDPSSVQMLKKVKTIFPASVGAMTSLECTYTFRMLETKATRRCIYRFDGLKRYQGSVNEDSGTFVLPMESAWDGQRAYNRGFVNLLSVSADRTKYDDNCPRPDAILVDLANQALGLAPVSMGRMYKFKSASSVTCLDHQCIEITFDAPWTGGNLVMDFASDLGYWPISYKLMGSDGAVWEEIKESKFFTKVSGGNALVFPVHIVLSVHPTGLHPSIQIWDVALESLHINEHVDPALFKLTPWPSDEVYDWDASKMRPASDPDWSPVGKVGFPWGDFVVHMHDPPKVAAIRPLSNTDTPSATLVSEASKSEKRYSSLFWLGMAVAAGALAWRYHQKRQLQ
jgi:hypothetical protein